MLGPSKGPPLHPSTSGAGLRRLGWDEAWANALSHAPAPLRTDAVIGRVSRVGRGTSDVLVATGADLATVTAGWAPALERAVAHDPTAVPAAGDWVLLHGGSGPWTLGHVLPRRTAVVRAQVAQGSSYGQVLAANATVAAVVEGMAPDADLARIERLLALAWSSGATPVVVLTKCDLVTFPQALVQEVAEVAPGVDVVAVSSTDGTGLEPLRAWLAEGSTVALLGASGVGKSTLLNALVAPGGSVMRTQALRSDGKGRHTTVTRELHLAPGGGAVLDTPGLRTIGLAGHDALDEVFTDVEELAVGCRFTDCAHLSEPGCAVLAAVEVGDLPERRLLSYRKLLREAEHQAARVDQRLRAAMAGRSRAMARQHRRYPSRP